MNYREFCTQLQSALGLTHTPIGIAFLQTPPKDVSHAAKVVPSACTFWRQAEQEVFYATAEDHLNCPIGALTMGFSLPEAAMNRLTGLVQQMCDIEYLHPDEAERIPTVKKPHQVAVYGPLGKLPCEPDVVLLICTPFQAMLLAEATAGACWTESPGTTAFGRPACAAIPQALQHESTTLSLGCMGARTYADLQPDEIVMVIPRNEIDSTAQRLHKVLASNNHMKAYYQSQKANFTPS